MRSRLLTAGLPWSSLAPRSRRAQTRTGKGHMRSTGAAALVLFSIATGAGGALAAPSVFGGGPEPKPIRTNGQLAYQGAAIGLGSQDLQSFTGRSFTLQLD